MYSVINKTTAMAAVRIPPTMLFARFSLLPFAASSFAFFSHSSR